MFSTRLFHLFLVALSIATAAQAAWFDFGFIGKAKHEIAARQNDDTSSASPSATKTSAAATTSATPTTTSAETTTPTTATTPTSTPATTTTPTTAPTTTPPSATPTTTTPPHGPSSSPTNGGTSSPDSNTSASSTPSDTTSGTPTPTTSYVSVTITASDGSVMTSSSATVVTPSLSQSTSSQDPGMPKQTQNIIIGVCAGIGGAIVLAVAGIFIWRFRRRRSQEDGEDLVNYGAGTSQFNSGPSGPEKSEASGSVSGRSPFQSTLESYHAPTQSNTGTNF